MQISKTYEIMSFLYRTVHVKLQFQEFWRYFAMSSRNTSFEHWIPWPLLLIIQKKSKGISLMLSKYISFAMDPGIETFSQEETHFRKLQINKMLQLLLLVTCCSRYDNSRHFYASSIISWSLFSPQFLRFIMSYYV